MLDPFSLTEMRTIQALPPSVTQNEAIALLAGGIAGVVRAVVIGPLRFVADAYIPFRLLQVEISNASAQEQRFFGIDAVSGSLDLYRFESEPDPSHLISVSTRNCLEARLDDAFATKLVVDKVRRELFSRGFFRMRDLHISAKPVDELIYVPYWIGFRDAGKEAHVSVIDAIRRRFEGGKVRNMLANWIRESPNL